MTLKASSSILSLIFTGRWHHILNPWKLIMDFDAEVVKVRKRNWYLIGVDESIAPMKFVRRIDIDSHLFGADISLKIYGSGTIEVKSISKRNIEKIKESILKFNDSKDHQTRILF